MQDLLQPNPFGRTVTESLVLPDGNALLYVIHDLMAGMKRFCASRACYGDDHRFLSNLKVPDSVDGGNCADWILADGLLDYFAQIALGVRMARVSKFCYAAPLIFVPDYTGEDGYSTRRRDVAYRGVDIR